MRLSVLLLLLVMLLDLRAGGEPPRSNARRRMSLRRHHHRTRGNTFRMMAEQPGRAWPENRPGRPKCEATEEQTRGALHIVTARVEHVGPFTSRIKVRRVLKGAGLPEVVTISTCRVICCSLSKRDFRLFLLGRPETVDGEDVFPQMAPPVGVSFKTLGRVRASTRVPVNDGWRPLPPTMLHSLDAYENHRNPVGAAHQVPWLRYPPPAPAEGFMSAEP
ncbi:hypothetical protein E2C01_024803 [Portunus trituberculatus]|uniref:Uncharacterized protein n=1 Tax=Portunus trituberculatus TaxID=210409 RepID=A0A5B7EB90_PORTR|nr:hypothetical protein [Portunus trituberculatus]